MVNVNLFEELKCFFFRIFCYVLKQCDILNFSSSCFISDFAFVVKL